MKENSGNGYEGYPLKTSDTCSYLKLALRPGEHISKVTLKTTKIYYIGQMAGK
jgi:hypothetical protein